MVSSSIIGVAIMLCRSEVTQVSSAVTLVVITWQLLATEPVVVPIFWNPSLTRTRTTPVETAVIAVVHTAAHIPARVICATR